MKKEDMVLVLAVVLAVVLVAVVPTAVFFMLSSEELHLACPNPDTTDFSAVWWMCHDHNGNYLPERCCDPDQIKRVLAFTEIYDHI